MERTLILIKPDGVCKSLIGRIIERLEKEGLKIVGLKMISLSKEKAEELYLPHKDKHFFQGLIDFMISAPCVALIAEGKGAIKRVREIIGETKPEEARPGTIRNRYAFDGRRNIIHSSDCLLSAQQEISCLFKLEEIYSYEKNDWLKNGGDKN
ncbi:nucleoside-diphosphate kinase [Candidatus Aerophobetes bacterium]|nr:nucleoside-diphosphate kinase [Candidatus Aerophobetes bacterium]